MGRRLKETWELAELDRRELQISSKIDVDQAWKMKY